MLYYIMEDQNLLSEIMLIQILQTTLKKNHFRLYIYNCKKSCEMGL